MLITRENPIGIDAKIDSFQKELYEELGWSDYISYPRCYKNKRADNSNNEYYAPEYADGLKNYTNVLYNDKVTALTFFIKDDNLDYVDSLTQETDVYFYVSCNINDLYPTIPHRADEELKRDVLGIVKKYLNGWEFQGSVDGIDNVFREFKTDSIKWANIAPRHVVRFDFKVTYNINCCC